MFCLMLADYGAKHAVWYLPFHACSFLEEERQTLTESWKKAESARKFLQSEVAALQISQKCPLTSPFDLSS